jgi:hypothetical protein
MAITELLKQATNDILTEETLQEIQNAFNKSVEDKVSVHVEKALSEQDNDYAKKLKHLLEVVDKDHTNKLIKVVEAIDINHSQKLRLLVKKFNKELNNNASGFKASMINNVSTYLEAYLDEAVPMAKLKEAVKSKRAQVVLEQIKEMLGVDTAVAKKAVRSAIVDGKRQIDEANKKLEAAQKELQHIKEDYSSTRSELVLEKKLTNVEGQKKNYLKKIMTGKSAKFINENFDYASNLFEKSKSERLQTLREEAITESTTSFVDRPVLEEKVQAREEYDTNPNMSPYLAELNKF